MYAQRQHGSSAKLGQSCQVDTFVLDVPSCMPSLIGEEAHSPSDHIQKLTHWCWTRLCVARRCFYRMLCCEDVNGTKIGTEHSVPWTTLPYWRVQNSCTHTRWKLGAENLNVLRDACWFGTVRDSRLKKKIQRRFDCGTYLLTLDNSLHQHIFLTNLAKARSKEMTAYLWCNS